MLERPDKPNSGGIFVYKTSTEKQPQSQMPLKQCSALLLMSCFFIAHKALNKSNQLRTGREKGLFCLPKERKQDFDVLQVPF